LQGALPYSLPGDFASEANTSPAHAGPAQAVVSLTRQLAAFKAVISQVRVNETTPSVRRCARQGIIPKCQGEFYALISFSNFGSGRSRFWSHRRDQTAPGGTGVVQSTEGQDATNNKDTTTMTPAGSKATSTGTEPGTGMEDSVQGEGATTKQGMDDTKEGKGATNMGTPAGNAPGGTGVETGSQGEGSKDKTSN
jgi:hypothetical protein